jgi:ribulose kinase
MKLTRQTMLIGAAAVAAVAAYVMLNRRTTPTHATVRAAQARIDDAANRARLARELVATPDFWV